MHHDADLRAVFLDRDGVIVAESPPQDPPDTLTPLPGVDEAIERLHRAGWRIVVVTNQPVIARGLRTEAEIDAQHRALAENLGDRRAVIDAFYVCPHHPDATVARYRVDCECRKPRPGMLLRARDDLGIDLRASVMVGDRMTDVEAGVRAGCGLTVLVGTTATQPRIVTPDPPLDVEPDWRARDLTEVAGRLLATTGSMP